MQTTPDESFTQGASIYGPAPDLYHRIQPTDTVPETTTQYNIRFAPGALFDGVQINNGLSAGQCSGVFDTGIVGAVAGDHVWHVQRHVYLGETTTVGVPSHFSFSGVQSNDSFRAFGVCANVNGGTQVTPGSDITREYRSDVSGYFLIEARQVLSRHRVFLLELNAGVITVLGDQLVREVDPEHDIPLDGTAFQPRKLKLVVVENGVGALLSAFRTVPGLGDVALFGGGTISRGVRLADGRNGFGVQSRRTDTGGADTAGLIERFTVQTFDGSAVLFEDRFQRLQRNAARLLNDGTIAGRSLASLWIGDAESQDNTFAPMKGQLRHATVGLVATGVDTGVGNAPAPGYHIRQLPEVSPSQAYALTFTRVTRDTALEVEVGICLRFFPERFPSGLMDSRGRNPFNGDRTDYYKRGYSVAVKRDGAGVWTLEARHFDGTTQSSYVAPVIGTANLTSFGLALDTPILLEVDVQNFNGNTFGAGDFVALSASVDGSPVTWVSGTQPGIAADGVYLFDGRTGASNETGGSGFCVVCEDVSATGALATIDSFLVGTPSGNTGTLVQDMASVPILAETAGASGALVLPAEAGISERSDTSPIVHRMESGKVQPILSQPLDRLLYDITALLDEGEWQLLDALWLSNGSDTPFTWSHPITGVSITALFVDDSLTMSIRHTESGRTAYSVTLSIEQVFAATLFNP